MDRKKILLVIAFALFVFGIGFALYWVFFRTAPTIVPTTNFNAGNIPNINAGNVTIINGNTNQGTTGLPWQQYLEDKVSTVANGGLTEVSDVVKNPVKGLVGTTQGVQYYDANKEQFYKINDKGELVSLSDKKFYGVDKVTWAGNGDKAILEYPDGSNILYNFRTGKQVTLPQELSEFSFNTSNDQIAAKWLSTNEDNNWLIAANDDGSGMFLVEPLGDKSYAVQVGFSPDNQVVALHEKAVDVQNQEVYPIGLHGENFKSFIVDGSGFTSKWSDNGSTLLYSVYNESTDYNPNLWVTKGRTGELGSIKVSLNVSTWPDKCAFVGEDGMYCAVPQGLPRGAGFYPEIAESYPDNFYYIDLNSGLKTLLASPVGPGGTYTANNLFISPDGSILYFTDLNSGNLQSIRLK